MYCSLFRCSQKHSINNNDQNKKLSLCFLPLLWVCEVQTSRAKCPVSWLTAADSQALSVVFALSDSSWSLLIRNFVKPDRFHFLRMHVCLCERGERFVYGMYLCVHLCLQQLSEIISLYHVMPHVGIFPALPERLFCFLRLASAHRNAAY